MKKQFILSSLGVLTLVGGSWVAAQQRESDRPSYPGASSRAVDRAASESPVDRYDANSPDALLKVRIRVTVEIAITLCQGLRLAHDLAKILGPISILALITSMRSFRGLFLQARVLLK